MTRESLVALDVAHSTQFAGLRVCVCMCYQSFRTIVSIVQSASVEQSWVAWPCPDAWLQASSAMTDSRDWPCAPTFATCVTQNSNSTYSPGVLCELVC